MNVSDTLGLKEQELFRIPRTEIRVFLYLEGFNPREIKRSIEHTETLALSTRNGSCLWRHAKQKQ
jgi:hypothetical protein